nr:hypothetical protein [Desulfobacterales bacterium]
MDTNKGSKETTGQVCPICGLLTCFIELFGQESDFLKHMNNSWIEFLEGIKSLLDHYIDYLKEKKSTHKKRELIRIEVED